MATENESHEQEIAILLSRVETESTQRLETFKYNLSRTLRVDYADYNMSLNLPMTSEKCQALSDLLGSMFEYLKKQGISLS